jgi:hypothetical protein
MIFSNFHFCPCGGIELQALGLNWDLHNFADFVGLRVEPDGSAALTWVAPDQPNPWGDTNNRHMGCELRFSGVRLLLVTGRESEPSSEDRTLHDICKVTPEPGQYRRRREWPVDARFHLLLTFISGLSIEVDAAEAELRALDRLGHD